MFLLVLLHSFSKLFVCFLIFLIFDIFSSLSFIYLNILSMMVLYSLNNNLLFEAFVNMLLLSVFLLDFHYGANLFVCLVIFFFLSVNCYFFMETYLGNFYVVYYEDAFNQRVFSCCFYCTA